MKMVKRTKKMTMENKEDDHGEEDKEEDGDEEEEEEQEKTEDYSVDAENLTIADIINNEEDISVFSELLQASEEIVSIYFKRQTQNCTNLAVYIAQEPAY